MKNLLLIGGGGHCKSVIDSLVSGDNEFDKIGIIDIEEKVGTEIEGIKVIGTDAELKKFYEEGYQYAFITLGSIGIPQKRVEIYKYLKSIGFELTSIIDKSSVIGNGVVLKEGVYVGKNAVINVDTRISDCAIINTGAVVEHDCEVGRFVHVAPGSVICGNARIGDYTHIGANATIIQGITIGSETVVGAGSTIICDIGERMTVVGNPGRQIR